MPKDDHCLYGILTSRLHTKSFDGSRSIPFQVQFPFIWYVIAKNVNDGPPRDNGWPLMEPDTRPGPGYSPGPAPSVLSFYMCCGPGGIDHYYPPYACIFGPATGACPQPPGSSFPYAWLCTYQPGRIGSLVSIVLQTQLMTMARCTNNHIYRTAFMNLARLPVLLMPEILGFSVPC
jgi:hypothetical protein